MLCVYLDCMLDFKYLEVVKEHFIYVSYGDRENSMKKSIRTISKIYIMRTFLCVFKRNMNMNVIIIRKN